MTTANFTSSLIHIDDRWPHFVQDEPHQYQRGKGGKQARRPSGAAAIKRAARTRRNVRAKSSKRGGRHASA